ncbi:MAG: ABC transporter ATP-binding protein, partial [Mycobacteriales bacterium]
GDLDRTLDAVPAEGTAGLWTPAASSQVLPPGPGSARAGMGPGAGAGLGPGGGMLGALPATPELLAAVAALPPAGADPGVRDEDAARFSSFTLMQFLKPFRPGLALGLALVVLDALGGLAGPKLIQHGIDRGVGGARPGVLVSTSLLFLGITLAGLVVAITATRVTGRTGERCLFTLRVKSFAHLSRLGLDYYDREMAGRIMTRMTTDIDALSQFLQTGLTTAAVSVLSFAGVAVALLLLNAPLGGIALLVTPPLFIATAIFRRRSARAYTRARERIATVNAAFQESLSGVRVTQAFVRQERNFRQFGVINEDYRDARMNAQRLVALYFPFVEFLSEIAAALVLGFGASRVEHGQITAGVLIAFLLYLDMFFTPIQQLSQVFDGYQQARVGLDRIGDLLGTPTSVPVAAHARPVPRGLRGEIRFQDVRFRYPGTTADALSGVTVSIPAGETVAVVGETGAGKSTLVKLVARYYDVSSGAVTVDGVDLREVDLGAYRRRLGVVPQEPFLFAGTVRDAIAYGRPDASPAEVEAAARAVGAHRVVEHLPGGYLHVLGEGGRTLSAGERQLLALARALIVDPAILLLDEATATLDLVTEAEVNRGLAVLTHQRTTLLVAHRLSTAAAADRILVLDGGRVVEVGTHPELIERGGRYADMWAAFVGEPAPAVG